MLSLRHFTIFKAVSETGSFTNAAKKLYITQSAVSHAIRELEENTGTILFDRLSRQVRLTSAGSLFLEEITPILSACDSLEKRMGRLENQAPIHIVSSITIAAYWLPKILNSFREHNPRIQVYVTVVSAAEAMTALQSGKADLAFVEGTYPREPFVYRRFADYELEIVCAPSYPIPDRTLTLEEFCSLELLLREPGSAIRDTLDSSLFLLGYTPQPLWESVNSTALIEAAKAGLGLTVLPKVLVKDALSRRELETVSVQGLSMKNDLLAVWHKDKYLTSGLRRLLSCIPG